MQFIADLNSKINGIVWGIPMMILILGAGIYLSVGCGFPQFTHFIHIMKNTLGKAFEKGEKKEGAVSPFKAMCTALAASIGTGNIAGVSGAIALGGPGAVFWMWMSALLGMCTKYAEVTLAIKYRERNEAGDWVGGPMYYIRNGLGQKWNWLAVLFSLLACLYRIQYVLLFLPLAWHFGGRRFGLKTWLALLVTVVAAKIVGAVLPMAAKRIKLDPAVMASPFITTIVDALCLIVYFGVATAVLGL